MQHWHLCGTAALICEKLFPVPKVDVRFVRFVMPHSGHGTGVHLPGETEGQAGATITYLLHSQSGPEVLQDHRRGWIGQLKDSDFLGIGTDLLLVAVDEEKEARRDPISYSVFRTRVRLRMASGCARREDAFRCVLAFLLLLDAF